VGALEGAGPSRRHGDVGKELFAAAAYSYPAGLGHTGSSAGRGGDDFHRVARCSVHEHVHRSPSQLPGGEQHRGPHQQAPDGVRSLDPHTHQEKAHECDHGGADVGDEVERPRPQRVRALRLGSAAQQCHPHRIDHYGESQQGEGIAGGINMRSLAGEADHSLPADARHDHGQHHHLGKGGEVLRLGVPVVVRFVGRPPGHSNGEVEQHQRHQVEPRIDRLRQ
jgi:hypothetical protein